MWGFYFRGVGGCWHGIHGSYTSTSSLGGRENFNTEKITQNPYENNIFIKGNNSNKKVKLLQQKLQVCAATFDLQLWVSPLPGAWRCSVRRVSEAKVLWSLLKKSRDFGFHSVCGHKVGGGKLEGRCGCGWRECEVARQVVVVVGLTRVCVCARRRHDSDGRRPLLAR